MAKLRITVTLKGSVEDAEGQSVAKALKLLGYKNVDEVRTGKVYRIKLKGGDLSEGEEFCSKLLSNPVINDCRVEFDED